MQLRLVIIPFSLRYTHPHISPFLLPFLSPIYPTSLHISPHPPTSYLLYPFSSIYYLPYLSFLLSFLSLPRPLPLFSLLSLFSVLSILLCLSLLPPYPPPPSKLVVEGDASARPLLFPLSLVISPLFLSLPSHLLLLISSRKREQRGPF